MIANVVEFNLVLNVMLLSLHYSFSSCAITTVIASCLSKGGQRKNDSPMTLTRPDAKLEGSQVNFVD